MNYTGQQNSSHLTDVGPDDLILPILGVLNPNPNSEFFQQVSVLKSEPNQILAFFNH